MLFYQSNISTPSFSLAHLNNVTELKDHARSLNHVTMPDRIVWRRFWVKIKGRKFVSDRNFSRQTKLFHGCAFSLQTVDCPKEIYFNKCLVRLKGHSLNNWSSRKCCINGYVGVAYVRANFEKWHKSLTLHSAKISAKLSLQYSLVYILVFVHFRSIKFSWQNFATS